MAVTMPILSREYVFVPLTNMNVDIDNLNRHHVAFKLAGDEPVDADWISALVVSATSNAAIYATFDNTEGLALLVGPTRGDSVTTETLAEGDWQVWVDVSVTASDERIVRVAGTLTVEDVST